jgi:signal transduction histidine kinase
MADRRLSLFQQRIALVLPPAVILGFALVLLFTIQRRRESAAWVEHTYRVIGGIGDLRTRLVDAETGQRGYLITGDTAYLAPYHGAEADVWRLFARIHRETLDNPVQQRSLASLRLLLARRLEILNGRIAIYRTRSPDAAREAVARGGGMEVMEGIRRLLGRMQAEEHRVLELRKAEEEARSRVVGWALGLGLLLSALSAVLTGAVFRAGARSHEELNAELSRRNAQLEDQAMELELQAEEMHAQARHLEENAAELEMANEELHAQGGRLEETAAELEAANGELQRANLLLRERTAEAEAANRAKAGFLSTMSHELRTPLNAIAGYVDLLDLGIHGPITGAQRSALARIQKNQAHLLGLISDILNFARIEAGRLELRAVPVAVPELLAGMEPLIAPQAAARGVEFRAMACDPHLRARGDRDRVGQVLLNLLSNAVKFTEPGGTITLWAEADGEQARIRVGDTGPGIPRDKQGEIFDPFVQLMRESGDLPSHGGVGLGLSISRELARAMEGDLTVESEVGRGSTFTLTLRRVARVAAPHMAPGDGGSAGERLTEA